MHKIILTDVDGVLVDWNISFEQYMDDLDYEIQVPGRWKIEEKYGVDPLQAHALVKAFNEGPYICRLPAMSDAVPYVRKLATQGFKFIAVTSIGDHPQTKIHRTTNLLSLYGPVFDEIVCLRMGSSKDFELARWKDSKYFWIEDHMNQAEAGYNVGLRPVLVSHPYNEHYETDLFPIVSNDTPWAEIYDIVSRDYNLK